MSQSVGSIHYDLDIDTSKFNSQVAQVNEKLDGVGSAMLGVAKKVAVVGGAMAAMGAVVGIKTAAELETARQGFITLLGSAEKADATMARVKKEAARTPFEVPGLTKATQLLTAVTHDGDKALDLILSVGEGLAAMGRGQEELDRIAVNMQQIAATGRATQMDVRQFAFAGIPIFEMLSQETGLAGEALDKFISDGNVSFDLLTNMFKKSTAEGGRFFNAYKNQAGTFDQTLSNLKDTVKIFLADFIKQSGIFDKVKKAMMSLNDFMVKHKGEIMNGLKVAFTVLYTAISLVVKIIGTIIKFLSEHKVVAAAVAGIIGTLMVAAFVAWAIAAASAAIATIAATWPLLLLGAAIGAVAYLIISHWNTIKNAFAAAIDFIRDHWQLIIGILLGPLGIILGLVISHFTQIKNFIIGVWDAVYNAVTTIFTTIINFFSGVLGWLYEAGRGIIQGLINGVRNMAGAVWGAIKSVADQIGAFFAGAGRWLWDTGRAIIGGLVDGIKSAAGWVRDAISNVVSDIKKGFTAPLRIFSPSKVFMGYGENIAVGLAMGIQRLTPKVVLATEAMGTSAKTAAQRSIENNTNIGNINIASTQDADYLLRRLDRNVTLESMGSSPA